MPSSRSAARTGELSAKRRSSTCSAIQTLPALLTFSARHTLLYTSLSILGSMFTSAVSLGRQPTFWSALRTSIAASWVIGFPYTGTCVRLRISSEVAQARYSRVPRSCSQRTGRHCRRVDSYSANCRLVTGVSMSCPHVRRRQVVHCWSQFSCDSRVSRLTRCTRRSAADGRPPLNGKALAARTVLQVG